METTQLKVGGMTCGGCANSVKKVVSALPGVSAVDVDWQAGQVVVSHAAGQPAQADIAAAIESAGFDVQG